MDRKQTLVESQRQDLYSIESERVLASLGATPDGGIVDQIEHVGATSVPGLHGQPHVDMAVAVWPFPLEDPARKTLASLGYELDREPAGASESSRQEQRFRHASTPVRLYVAEAGGALFMDYVLMRDYLRHDPAACQDLSSTKQVWDSNSESSGYHTAKRRWFDAHQGDARQLWIAREGFAPLRRVTDELHDLPVAWHVCGGWALDLFLGRVTRVHLDVDILVSRDDQHALREYMAARGWTLMAPYDGRILPWPPYMTLDLPRHQVLAFRRGAFLDFLLSDAAGGVWRYRRRPAVIRDMTRIGLHSDDGIPFLSPELVLLFKSRNTSGRERGKDQTDFERTHTAMELERRAWLRWALTSLDPSHPWIQQL